MSLLRDSSQPEFYISALEKWITKAKNSGTAETLLVDIILANGTEQIPELCKRMFGYFDISLKGNSKSFEKIVTWSEAKEAEKIVTWLKTKFWKNMQEIWSRP